MRICCKYACNGAASRHDSDPVSDNLNIKINFLAPNATVFFSPLLSVSDVNETHKTSPQPAIELHKIITQKNTEEHIKEYTKENPSKCHIWQSPSGGRQRNNFIKINSIKVLVKGSRHEKSFYRVLV